MIEVLLYLGGILLAFVGIAFSIAWHELGHLIPAKKFGIRCPQYMIGFGPTLWSGRRGETEYGVKAIPLGGFVRMIGMFPPPKGAAPGQVRPSSTGRFSQLADQVRADSLEELEPGDEDRVFYRLPVWKRVVIMLGGPVMNLILAVAILAVTVTTFGVPAGTTEVSEVTQCVVAIEDVEGAPPTDCTGETPTPAVEAGLQPGDVITSVNGTAVSTWNDAVLAIQSAGSTLTLGVERDGQQLALPTVDSILVERPERAADGEPVLDADGQPVLAELPFLGATGSTDYVAQPVTEVPAYVGQAIGQTAGIFLNLPERMVGVFHAAFSGDVRDPESPLSVVGVGRIAGEVTSGEIQIFGDSPMARLNLLLNLLASLNLALFVFNLIPLLPLDGGHVAGALWEGVKRTWARVFRRPEPAPVDVAKALPLAYGVSIVLIAMAALLIYADLVNPIQL